MQIGPEYLISCVDGNYVIRFDSCITCKPDPISLLGSRVITFAASESNTRLIIPQQHLGLRSNARWK